MILYAGMKYISKDSDRFPFHVHLTKRIQKQLSQKSDILKRKRDEIQSENNLIMDI